MRLKRTVVSHSSKLGRALGLLLVSTVLIVSFVASSPSLSKYVLDSVGAELTFLSGTLGNPLESIGDITGTTMQYQTLTAGAVLPVDATYTLKWQRANAIDGIFIDIPEAHDPSYILVFDDNNRYIRVAATGTGDYTETIYSNVAGPVVVSATPITAMSAIQGDAVVGETITAGALTPINATATYQWKIADSLNGTYTNLTGATNTSLVLTEAMVDKFVRVYATGSSTYSGTVYASLGPIRSDKTPITAIASISGTTQVGTTLTVGVLTPLGATATYQWQRSDISGSIFSDIAGETGTTYVPTAEDDLNLFLRVVAVGSGDYSGTVTSVRSGPVVSASIPLESFGNISGTAQVGQTLNAGALEPTGATANYQWFVADNNSGTPGSWSAVGSATSSTYTIPAAYYNRFLKVEATGSGSYSGNFSSNTVGPVTAILLQSIGNISGSAVQGQTVNAGTILPSGATVNYVWQRASSAGGTYNPISGATGASYELTASDVNQYVRVSVTGTGAYSGTVNSNYIHPVEEFTPLTYLVSIADSIGITQVFQTLTAGTVSPYGASVTYQWYRSDAMEGTYQLLSGETSKTLYINGADKGYYFKVIATGSGAYAGSVTSRYAGPITAAPLTAIGNISGTASTGHVLTAGAVSPAGATVNYQWLRSDLNGANYLPIIGATSNTYGVVTSDEGRYLKVQVTGTGLYTGLIISEFSGPVLVTPIAVTALGDINGYPQVGQTLSAGTITPLGATVTYQWSSAAISGGTYTNIAGATASTYVTTPTDLNQFLKLTIWGAGTYTTPAQGITSNAFGSITTRPITAISNIIGKAQVDQVLTAGTVSPVGANVIYQWQYYNGTTYVDIVNATSNTYTITIAENNRFIRVKATGSNGYSGVVYSNNTGPVGSPNAITSISDITGVTRVGQTLSAGVVLPHGATISYQWMRSAEVDGTYEAIAGATNSQYILTSTDQGKYMKVIATGYGTYFGEVISNPTDLIDKGLVTSVSDIVGQTIVGQTLASGSVSPTGATVSYQWQRNDGSGFQDIPSATLSSYLLTVNDQGKTIRVVVSGTGAYEGTAQSNATSSISPSGTGTQSLSSIAATTGTTTVGQTLTTGAVLPAGATYSLQWQRSDASGSNYTNIQGAIGSMYTLTAADFGFSVRPVATGTGTYIGTVTAAGQLINGRQPIVSIGNISGSTNVGGNALAGSVTPSGATVTYQWYRHIYDFWNGWQSNQIVGATEYYYNTVSADENYYLEVVVTGIGAYSGTASSAYFGEINSSPYQVTAIGSITGSARVTNTLTAGETTPFGASVTYQWLRKAPGASTYSEILGATSKTYLLQPADYNSVLKVVATGSGGYTGWVESTPTSQILPGFITSLSSTVGTTSVGQILQAGTTLPVGATVTYQWFRSNTAGTDFVEMMGATNATYGLTGDDLGCSLKVQVTGYGAYTGTLISNATGPVLNSSTALTSIGAFTGTLRVNSTVTAGALLPGGSQATLQWQRGDVVGGPFQDIAGATGTSYILTPDDYLKYIRVKAVGSGAYTGTVYSTVQGPIQPCIITGIGNWSGSLRIGQSLVAGVPIPAEATVNYTWEIQYLLWNNTGVTTNSILIPNTADSLFGTFNTVGRSIRVTITGTGAYSGSFTITIGNILSEITVNPVTSIGSIQGTTSPGQTLTAGTVSPLGATVNYQWQKAMNPQDTFENIAGATANTYQVQAGDLGYYFKVIATGTGSYSGIASSTVKGPTVDSGATIPVTAISNILYSQTPEVITLTAGVVTPFGADVTYQWYRSDTTSPTGAYSAISGATSSTYTIPAGQSVGYYFKVMATGSGSYSSSVTSNYTGPVVLAAALVNLTQVNIGGINQVGETLSASLLPAGATATYQWQVFTGVGGVFADIPGATSSTYTLQPNQYNYYIKVIATGSGAYTSQVSAETTSMVVGLIESAQLTMASPFVGGTPQTAAQVETLTSSVDYTVSNLTWNEPLTPLGKFMADTSYSATITLTSKNMKTVIPSGFTPIVPGSASIEDIVVTGSGVGNTVQFTVNYGVTSPLSVSSLTILNQPTKLFYTEGSDDVLDLSGLEVTEHYNDGSTNTVSFASGTPAGYTTAPVNGGVLTGEDHNQPVVITHTASSTTIGTAQLNVEAPPKVTNVSISGELVVGETLTGEYTYSDANGDEEDTDATYYEWLVDSISVSSGAGSSYLNYLLTAADAGKTVIFKITPVAESGTLTGSVVSSAESLPVATSALSAATVNMTTPVVGATPENTGNVETLTSDSNFTVSSLSWTPAFTTGGKFAASTSYTATITLTSKNGTAFSATPFTPSIIGALTISNTVRSGNGAGNSVTFTAEFSATEALQLVSITASSQPSKLVYKEMTDEVLSLVGLTITETYNDGSTVVVEFIDGVAVGYSATPAHGAVLTVASNNGNPITITHDATAQTTETANLTVTEQHAPTVSNVTISGTPRVYQTLTGHYTYSDADGDTEGTSLYQWYANDVAISGATSITYTLTTNERSKTIKFQVTPVASAGITPGTAVRSSATVTILQTIDIATIGGVTVPADNATPDTSVNQTTQYTGTTSWSSPSGFRSTGKYKNNVIYTATITITPKAGYTLDGVPADFFTVAGSTSDTNPANSGVVTAVFPQT